MSAAAHSAPNGSSILRQTFRVRPSAGPIYASRVGIAIATVALGATVNVTLQFKDRRDPQTGEFLLTELEPFLSMAMCAGGLSPAKPPTTTASENGSAIQPEDDDDDPDDRSEAAEGRRFVRKLTDLARDFPEAADVYHVPNGGKRGKLAGYRLQQEGVVPGVLDYALDVARWDVLRCRVVCGWRGELKRATGGEVSDGQRDRLDTLNATGDYWAEAHFGHEALLRDLRRFLALPPVPNIAVLLEACREVVTDWCDAYPKDGTAAELRDALRHITAELPRILTDR